YGQLNAALPGQSGDKAVCLLPVSSPENVAAQTFDIARELVQVPIQVGDGVLLYLPGAVAQFLPLIADVRNRGLPSQRELGRRIRQGFLKLRVSQSALVVIFEGMGLNLVAHDKRSVVSCPLSVVCCRSPGAQH